MAGLMGPTLGIMLYCAILKFSINFEQGAPRFHFALGPAYHVVLTATNRKIIMSGFEVTLFYIKCFYMLSHLILTTKQPEEKKW